MTTYFIDQYNRETYAFEEVDHWKNLHINDVEMILEHTDFEEGFIYCLSEEDGEEDIARWTHDDQALINAWLEYQTEKSIFSNVHD